MKRKLGLGCFFVAAVSAMVASLPASAQLRVQEEAYFREATRILASDEFAGRKPMSEQEHLTIDYIIQEYKKAGLKPGNNGEWLQPVEMISTETTPVGGAINIKSRKAKVNLRDFEDFIVWTHRGVNRIDFKNAEFVFVGHGITAPEYGWDDYEGIDVKGKIVLALAGDPGFYDDNLFRGQNATYYSRQHYKFEQAERCGAAGCMVIHEASASGYKWETLQGSQTGAKLGLVNEDMNRDLIAFQGWLAGGAAERLFSACGLDFDSVCAAAHKTGFKSFSLNAKSSFSLDVKYSVGKSYNVIGMIEGTDLKDEYVLYSSHWDHFGIGKPDETGDCIYNGANDSATGIAALFIIAQKYMRSPMKPRRSILFVSVTGEESGFLGSEYYCTHPSYPLEKTAVNLNIDGPGPFESSYDVLLRAPGVSTAEKWLWLITEAQGREVKPYPVDPKAIYYRCDHFSFIRHGVPALFFDKGSDFVDKERHERLPKYDTYHKPNDEYHDWWVVDGAMENINIYYAVGMLIACDEQMPQWSPDSEFQR